MLSGILERLKLSSQEEYNEKAYLHKYIFQDTSLPVHKSVAVQQLPLCIENLVNKYQKLEIRVTWQVPDILDSPSWTFLYVAKLTTTTDDSRKSMGLIEDFCQHKNARN